MPLCARCSGIYLAFSLSWLVSRVLRKGPAPVALRPLWLALVLVSVAPLHAWLGSISGAGWERFLAGAICGIGLAMMVGAGWPESVAVGIGTVLLAVSGVPLVMDALALASPFAVSLAVAAPVWFIFETRREALRKR